MHHFEGKDALSHVIEKKEEIHGTVAPKSLATAFASSSETALVLLLISLVLKGVGMPIFFPLFALSCGWIIWKTASVAHAGWIRLERLHRLVEQEKYEIENHRPQERQELVALYQSKGFEGKLLDDVVDVLMADSDRLLKVMLEEEMGLTLESEEHPLKTASGAFFGSLAATILILAEIYFFPTFGLLFTPFVVIVLSSIFLAKRENNHLLNGAVWSLAIATLSAGVVYFLL